MSKNRECSSFLGVFVAEGVLKDAFNEVEQMPYGNKGFDFICNHGKKIDVKSGCLQKARSNWVFVIKRNTIADYFLFLAFDNRDDLNPLYIWLIPGEIVNHQITTSIRMASINKWNKYRLDIDKVVSCCDILKNGQNK